MSPAENAAVAEDARRQIRRLRAIRDRLIPDAAGDHAVLLELAWVNGQIRQAMGELGLHAT